VTNAGTDPLADRATRDIIVRLPKTLEPDKQVVQTDMIRISSDGHGRAVFAQNTPETNKLPRAPKDDYQICYVVRPGPEVYTLLSQAQKAAADGSGEACAICVEQICGAADGPVSSKGLILAHR
jgi:hypothetical protein